MPSPSVPAPSCTLASTCRTTSRPSLFAVAAVAMLPVLALAPRWMRGPRYFAWDVGDTAGTMSHVRAVCLNQDAARLNPFINYPFGFDVSAYPFWNLLDEFRTHTASIFGCSTHSLVVIFALTPLVAMIGNCMAGYFLGYSIFSRNIDGLLMAIFGVFSPTILLQTRTSLSNNVLFFGLLAVASISKYCQNKRVHWIFIYGSLLTLQLWSNVYNGAMTIFTCAVVVLSLTKMQNQKRRWRTYSTALFATIIFFLLGIAPLLVSQWFLLAGNLLGQFARPSDTQRMSLLDAILSPNFLTAGALLTVGAAITTFIKGRSLYGTIWPLTGIGLIICLNLDTEIFGPFHYVYNQILGPLRGVSYFLTIVPILGAFVLIMLRNNSPLGHILGSQTVRRILVPLLLIDAVTSLPRIGYNIDPTFYRSTTLEDVAAPFPDDQRLAGGLLQLPDYYYSGSENHFGAPGREILIDQMIHGLPLLNGRDFITSLRNCADVYSVESLINFEVLHARGGRIVALRVTDLSAEQLGRIRKQLMSFGWNNMQLPPDNHAVHLELWVAPTKPSPNFDEACKGAW